MIITDPGLELRSDWTLETGPNINPIPADSFVGTHMGDSSYRITNVSSKAYGGALLTNKRQVPMLQGSTMNQVFYAGLDLEFLISSADLPFLWAHETDVKACVQGAPNSSTKIPNVFNWSAQVNMGKGGMFQIDAIPGKPGWVDTGIKVPPVPVAARTARARPQRPPQGQQAVVVGRGHRLRIRPRGEVLKSLSKPSAANDIAAAPTSAEKRNHGIEIQIHRHLSRHGWPQRQQVLNPANPPAVCSRPLGRHRLH